MKDASPYATKVNLQIADEFASQVDGSQLECAIIQALRQDPPAQEVEVTLVVTNDSEVQQLNKTYRHIDAATDVLSFTLGQNPFTPPDMALYLGDIVISFPRCQAQAAEHDHTTQQEMNLLAIHGTLHLLGYDHATEPEKAVMWRLQEAALAQIES